MANNKKLCYTPKSASALLVLSNPECVYSMSEYGGINASVCVCASLVCLSTVGLMRLCVYECVCVGLPELESKQLCISSHWWDG